MPTTAAQRLRAELDHPVVDADGHLLELRPVIADWLRDHGRGDLVERAPMFTGQGGPAAWREVPAEVRVRDRLRAPSFWIAPGDADYFAMVTSPALYAERLAEAGIDFAVLYPSMGLHVPDTGDDVRVDLCKMINRFTAEQWGPFADRFAPAAVVPMHAPDEAVEVLDDAVALGFTVGVIPSYVKRPVAGDPTGRTWWIDTYGIDSAHDYDPVWARAVEHGVALSCHSVGMGFTDRSSISNYMYNHIGHFAATGEALAKSLFFGGVTRRFPDLRLAMLEGGAAVGVRLYGDIVSRWKKRGPAGLPRLNPDRIDRQRLGELYARYNPLATAHDVEQLIASWSSPADADRDDFALTGVESVEDIRDAYCRNFFWGSEADDPLTGLAFDPRVNPLGASVPAMMGSDIGHWDVPDPTEPLVEAYELVDDGIIDPEQFRDFVFLNAVRCYGLQNPDFFAGTTVEAAVAEWRPRLLAGTPDRAPA